MSLRYGILKKGVNMNTQLQTLKGFRDFLPEEKRKRDFVTQKVKEVFEQFGFSPLETPTLEYASLLLGKYGDEADKLVYTFEDNGKRNVALRYDQTVPTARVLAQYRQNLPKYFRRYQIQNVFRADKPQKGRFREFTQCDIDIFGSRSPVADAEILACTYASFVNVGFPDVSLRINDRNLLFSVLEPFSSEQLPVLSIIQTIDKLDKVGQEGVLSELEKKGMEPAQAKNALDALSGSAPTEQLDAIISAAQNLGVPKTAMEFVPMLARGLDYYTGMIFEVVVPSYGKNSLGGGGRYDRLIRQLGGPDVPAVGIAFGFDRMVEAAEEFKLIPSAQASAEVLVTVFGKAQLAAALSAAKELRAGGIATEVFPSTEESIGNQLKYASKQGIPYVAILGEEEEKKKEVKIKDMQTGKQYAVQTCALSSAGGSIHSLLRD